MHKLSWKIRNTLFAFGNILLKLPNRIYDFVSHFGRPLHPIYRQVFPNWFWTFWFLEAFLRLLEIFGLAELYETLATWLKVNTRPLNAKEKTLLLNIFGPHFPYQRIGIDERAYIGPMQMNVCYVSFLTINSWKKMSDCLLVHEMVHTWQYQRLGIVYIPRALAVQCIVGGYNYGGIEKLQEIFGRNGKLDEFNLEQQADIVADYCRIKSGLGPSWGKGTWVDLPVYQYFVDQLLVEN
ncbi:MAG: hypothetical protein DHS20C18_03360 [Saprospiraceae bacterium]|nr:MAG: hypothetical protein DHS20C18_03360 [Saprospiraceae bacterium]